MIGQVRVESPVELVLISIFTVLISFIEVIYERKNFGSL